MDSQEDTSSAIAPSLMAGLNRAYNYFAPPQFEGWKACPTGQSLGTRSPSLVSPDFSAVQFAPAPNKRRLYLFLSWHKRPGRLREIRNCVLRLPK